MFDKINLSSNKQTLIVCIILTVATLAVYLQVNQFEFIGFDDEVYVTQNSNIQSGITLDGIRWAFGSFYARFWHPLTWLSLMLDNQLFGLQAGGYHMSNVILHVMSTLLLFLLFNRMTGSVWKSAFIAAFFALHPLRLESVAVISKRKDVLSVFFGMLTLFLYVYYAERPLIRRYLLVLFSFIFALMSKPMMVTLPVLMILLDYWPLKRFTSMKSDLILSQLKEKTPFFVLSAIFSIIAIFAHSDPAVAYASVGSRLAGMSLSFLIYLEKILWPPALTISSIGQFSSWETYGSSLLIIAISLAVMILMKRLPYLFVGWIWFLASLLPVIGIIQGGGIKSIANHYTYLPSIGIAVMLAFGIPHLFPRERARKMILIPAAIIVIAVLTVLTWQICSYFKNNAANSSPLLQVTKDTYLTHNNFSFIFPSERKINETIHYYDRAIQLKSSDAHAYNNRGTGYHKLGRYQRAIDDYNQAIRLKPDYAYAYSNRGVAYLMLGFIDLYCVDIEKACTLGECKIFEHSQEGLCRKPDSAVAYNDRGIDYSKRGRYNPAVDDFSRAILLKPDFADAYNNRGLTYSKAGFPELAVADFNQAILLKPDFAAAYLNRGVTYLMQRNNDPGCLDAQTACALGNCKLLELTKAKKLCR